MALFETCETLLNVIHGAVALGPNGAELASLAQEELTMVVGEMKAQKAKATPTTAPPTPPVPRPAQPPSASPAAPKAPG